MVLHQKMGICDLEISEFCKPGGVPECHQLSLVFLPVHALQLWGPCLLISCIKPGLYIHSDHVSQSFPSEFFNDNFFLNFYIFNHSQNLGY